ncbi:hypothetical protein HOI71_22450, partial [Candidatus Poribacteria bacterium]|nr:hypothetical protein [Candidatus Poribacteria bacterium]
MADERFTATEALETLESQPADQAALYDAVRTVKYSQICNTFIVEDSEKTHGFEDSHALIEDMMRLLLATLPRHDVWSDELEQGNYNLDVVRDSRDVYLALIRDLENLTDEERADTATRRQIHERIAKDHLKVQGLLRPHLHRVRRISTRGRALQPTEMFAFLNGAIHDLELGTEKVYRLFDTSAFPSTLSALTDQVEEASQEASDVRGEARGLQDRVEHIGNLLNDHSGNVDTAQKKLDKFLDKARDDIADFAKDRAMKVTVDLYTSVFQRLADKHLAASVLIGLGGVGLGIWAFLFMQTFIGEIAGIEQVTA